MRTWLSSIEGFTFLSVVAVLAFIGYAFLESRYFLNDWTPGVGAAALQMVVMLAIVGGWIWGVMAARDGSRAGVTAALVLSAVVAMIGLYDIIFYSPVRYGWPLVQIMLWAIFVTSALALVSSALVLSALR
jgi:hypothetical protein